MLHILLLILKIIGIIIAAILGILVLLICIVLFVPVRYEIAGKCDGNLDSLKGRAKVTWFLHLVRADICYKSGKVKWRFRIAWKKRTNRPENVEKEIKKAEKNEGKDVEKDEEELREEFHESVEEQEKADETASETPEVYRKEEPESIEEVHQKEEHQSTPEACEEEKTGYREEVPVHEEAASGKRNGISEKIKSICEKIKTLIQNIKCTFRRFCDKIKVLLEKKDKIVTFIHDEVHVSAFLKTKKELFKLLRRLRPKKTKINLEFGFEDPYRTGQALAGISLLYPFIGESAVIEPDFEKKVLKGMLYIKGNIRFCHLAAAAWNLLWSKDVRTTYKHIKNFEL